MGRRQSEERVQLALRRAIAAAILANHEIGERLGLGPSDAQFLHLLELHGSLTPGRFAELTGLTTGTVTGVLDRLEAAGFVHRSADPSDRRKVRVSRDEAVIARRMAPFYDVFARALADSLSNYRVAELELLADFLDRITSPATKGPPDASASTGHGTASSA